MKITQLEVKKGQKNILNKLDVSFEEGKIHIIMGPNGSGKSTLAYTIAGHPDCIVNQGEIIFDNIDIHNKAIEERALSGIYLAPQYPPVIEGLAHASFLKEALNVLHDYRNEEPVDDFQVFKQIKNKAKEYSFDPATYPKQSLNSGFSGGEKKRNEILQISLLQPRFVILDEIDSGLDIEAMKKIAQFINDYKSNNKTIVVITHYPDFAKLIQADKVHIIKNGQVSCSGDLSLISKVIENGFGDL